MPTKKKAVKHKTFIMYVAMCGDLVMSADTKRKNLVCFNNERIVKLKCEVVK